MSFLYFAYGSNMSLAQMRERCPAHERVGIAKLSGYALCFPRSSPIRLCGVAGIEERGSSEVWGVVYRLNAIDLATLDKREGYDAAAAFQINRYNRREVTVLLEGDPSRPAACLVYLARSEPGVHVPSSAYLGTMVEGAAENGLPAGYIETLRAIRCVAV